MSSGDNMADLIDPWASFSLDYDKLVNKFGIGDFNDIISNVKNPQILMKRGVIFGHRNFDEINNRMLKIYAHVINLSRPKKLTWKFIMKNKPPKEILKEV